MIDTVTVNDSDKFEVIWQSTWPVPARPRPPPAHCQLAPCSEVVGQYPVPARPGIVTCVRIMRAAACASALIAERY